MWVLVRAVILIIAWVAAAQDIAKVSPETHKVLLENDRVRVFDVRVKPGEKVGMHSHPAGILYYLTDAKLKIIYPDGKTELRDVESGTAVWSEPVTHAVENVGTTELQEIHTELKVPAMSPVRAKKGTSNRNADPSLY